MTENAERPLVTFAVFAYNQENYIREAIEGALSQTYESLEIILSDDCSSDRTFEIMAEIAGAYDGPHRIVLRQSEANRGLIRHINDIVSQASGDILVMAAGDDVSLPNRCDNLASAFGRNPSVMAVYSDVLESITDVKSSYTPQTIQKISSIEIFMNAGGIGRGAAYAYRMSLFGWLGEIPSDVKSEDKYLPAAATLIGSVCNISRGLVFYRRHEGTLTEAFRVGDSYAHQRPQHWREIFKLIDKASRDKRVGALEGCILRFCAAAAKQYKQNPASKAALAIFSAARLARRASRLEKTEVHFREIR